MTRSIGPLLRLLEVEKAPLERLAQRARAGIPLERDPDELDLVIAAAQLLDEGLGQDLGSAPLEQRLRRADGDSHSSRALVCEALLQLVRGDARAGSRPPPSAQ